MSGIKIERNRPLSELTTMRIGGHAEYYCEPENREEFQEALEFIRSQNLRYYILGGGSNTLFSDAGFGGMVISTRRMKSIRRSGDKIHVLSGTSMEELNNFCMKEGLSGLEFTGGLPGSAGGAVYMNARAYHGEISNVVASVTALTLKGEEINLPCDQLEYHYKHSVFMENPGLFIYEIEFSLVSRNPESVRSLTESRRSDRELKGQYDFPSAGCIFKNDHETGISSGQIIDSLGLKGKCVGGAGIYDRHANFIINKGGAKASDVLRLMEEIETEVYQKKGIKLEREVKVVE